MLLPGIDEAGAHQCASEIYTQVHNMTLRDGLTEIGGGCVDWHRQLPAAHPKRQPAARSGRRAVPGERAGPFKDCQLWPPEDPLSGIIAQRH